MIDIVIPLGRGSKWSNNELKFCLRSIETHLQNYRNIFIIGEDPNFLSDKVIFIPCPDIHSNPALNIATKVVSACLDERLSTEFALLNDDYFFVADVDISTYPFYYKCDLHHTVKINVNHYRSHVIATLKVLQENFLPIKNFDTHYPMRMEKDKVLDIWGRYDWNRLYGLILKSTYCNTFGIEGELRLDSKAVHARNKEWWESYASQRECFSIDDACLTGTGFKTFIEERFPHKSTFEL